MTRGKKGAENSPGHPLCLHCIRNASVSAALPGGRVGPAAIPEHIAPFPGGLNFAKRAIVIVSSFHLGETEPEGV